MKENSTLYFSMQKPERGWVGWRYRVDKKKVNLVLDQLDRCGFLHGVQHVSKNTSIVKLDIAKF